MAKRGPGEEAPARWIDEDEWRDGVVDLHRVMGMVKSLYLMLEHSNEATLRVAMELVTCPRTRRCLWWHDIWYSDEEKREFFCGAVKDKFSYVIAYIKGTVVREPSKTRPDRAAVEALQKRAETAEALSRAAQNQQRIAELRCREATEAAEEAGKRIRDLEKHMDMLRAMVRKQGEPPHKEGGKDTAGSAELHGSEGWRNGEAKDSKEQKTPNNLKDSKEVKGGKDGKGKEKTECKDCGKLRQRLADMVQQLRAASQEREQLAQQLEDTSRKLQEADLAAQKAAGEVKETVKETIKETVEETVQETVKETVVEVPVSSAAPASADAAELEASRHELEEARKRIAKLEAERDQLKAERNALQLALDAKSDRLAALEKQLKAAEQRAAELESALGAAQAAAGPPPSTSVRAVQTDGNWEQELERLRAKLRKRNDLIAQLQAEKEKLEEDELRLLETLRKLQEQLGRLGELAEQKGCKDVVQELMEVSKMAELLASKGGPVYARLYEDALRRQDKMRSLMQSRFGSTADSRGSTLRQMASPDLTINRTLTATFGGCSPTSSGSTWACCQGSPTSASREPRLSKTMSFGGLDLPSLDESPLSPGTALRRSYSEVRPRACLPEVNVCSPGSSLRRAASELASGGTGGGAAATPDPVTPCGKGATGGQVAPQMPRSASDVEALPRLSAASLSPDLFGSTTALGLSPGLGWGGRKLRGSALTDHSGGKQRLHRMLELSPGGPAQEQQRSQQRGLGHSKSVRKIEFTFEGLGGELGQGGRVPGAAGAGGKAAAGASPARSPGIPRRRPRSSGAVRAEAADVKWRPSPDAGSAGPSVAGNVSATLGAGGARTLKLTPGTP